eukprot:762812-Hanusia_phi.AAC.5
MQQKRRRRRGGRMPWEAATQSSGRRRMCGEVRGKEQEKARGAGRGGDGAGAGLTVRRLHPREKGTTIASRRTRSPG